MRWVLGRSFIGMAIWALIPDKIEGEEAHALISALARKN
jgi:putative Ca2+/H+ antiporter (TMEM165/GDT1 family)